MILGKPRRISKGIYALTCPFRLKEPIVLVTTKNRDIVGSTHMSSFGMIHVCLYDIRTGRPVDGEFHAMSVELPTKQRLRMLSGEQEVEFGR